MTAKKYFIPEVIKKDLKVVERKLARTVSTQEKVLTQAAVELLERGGKRLRPALVLLAGTTGNYRLERLTVASQAVELIHMASLIHDDVLDKARLRRGFPTINAKWGERAATAAGDFLFATAFRLLAGLGSPRVMKIMAKASEGLSVGEFQEIETSFDVAKSSKLYLTRIRNKTAVLFAACCASGAIISEVKEKDIKALENYGENLGMAFQIADDLLDFKGEEKELGKEAGADLHQGVITLPVLYALEDKDVGGRLSKLIKPGMTRKETNQAVLLVRQTKGLEKTSKRAQKYVDLAKKAITSISCLEAKRSLSSIGNFVVERYY